MNRRGFLSSCMALAAAPAIVRADSLMRIVPRDSGVLVPMIVGRCEGPVIVEESFERLIRSIGFCAMTGRFPNARELDPLMEWRGG